MNQFDIAILTPPGCSDPSIAIAACRAGALGILDFYYCRRPTDALNGLRAMARYSKHEFGVRLDGCCRNLLTALEAERTPGWQVVVLGFADFETLGPIVADIHRWGLKVILESTSLEEARVGEQLEVDALIAKGHEAGGRVGSETTFILLQRLLPVITLPVWAQGGIGLYSAVACRAAGASGVVLDAQLALSRESSAPEELKSRVTTMDGTETFCVSDPIGNTYRLIEKPGGTIGDQLRKKASVLADSGRLQTNISDEWQTALKEKLVEYATEPKIFALGQEASFAHSLKKSFITVGGIVMAIRESITTNLHQAAADGALRPHSAMAQSHGTRYPIVQGPMARVSDNADFISAVADSGALPFVAAAWMRKRELEALLAQVRRRMDKRPWGVGLLGFLPPGVLREQVTTVILHRPSFVLIAGGQPGQVKNLEKEGIATYLHVPSPGLLRQFLDQGVTRFVFEGRESGGHIGPLSSFTLWEHAIAMLVAHVEAGNRSENIHVLFAGGIHDNRSAAMVAAMASPLTARGIRVGLQLGSAYLFCREASTTGAICNCYTREAIRAIGTTVIESGPGHAVRCLNNAFTVAFEREKHRLIAENASKAQIQEMLERMKLGRLRIASKGLIKNNAKTGDPSVPSLVNVPEDQQVSDGMYLIGQVAALRNAHTTMAELHADICEAGTLRIESLVKEKRVHTGGRQMMRPSDVAIIGMACLLPEAPDVQRYWENILNKVNAVREIPPERWDWRLYYDSDRQAPDKVYSKWGAFIGDIRFDPTRYGIPPKALHSIEPLQLLTLETAYRALEDAGYTNRPFARDRTSVLLGISGTGELGQQYSFRSALPTYLGRTCPDIMCQVENLLPNWTEDSFPGILMNVTAGRVANRLDLGGTNFSVDGACASSLAALYLAVKELETRTSDLVIVGGADCVQNPFTFMCFSKTQALSPCGRCNALDQNADGIVIGEGIAILVLKRLAEAERDGDRIYAVIKGIGASSDGRDKSLTAPGRKGQIRALRRAYAQAHVSPADVGLIEAHATGTTVGDRVEVEALTEVFATAGAKPYRCAIGSAKSMIGHTKATAGLASMIKAVMALHYKVLPPTFGVQNPNKGLRVPDSPFFANTEARPWVLAGGRVRRAGVSAFGFGGTNFHVVLQEYENDFLDHLKTATLQHLPSELFLWAGASQDALSGQIQILQDALAKGARPSLPELAMSLTGDFQRRNTGPDACALKLAIVASTLEELDRKLASVRGRWKWGEEAIWDPRGIYFTTKPLAINGKIALLFPGQGSQYVNMLADLAILFPEVRKQYERTDRALEKHLPEPLSTYIFPASTFSAEEARTAEIALARTRIAQPALGTAEIAMFHLLESFGLSADMFAGHSYGEYAALCAAGVFSEDALIGLSEARARFIEEGAGQERGAMAAVKENVTTVESVIEGMRGLWVANINEPQQTVVTGTLQAVDEAIQRFKRQGIPARRISVSCAFHSPLVAPAREKLRRYLETLAIGAPSIRTYANINAKPYPNAPDKIVDQLVDQLTGRVAFMPQIEAMYVEGARIFIEVGPGSVLCGLVNKILADRPHLAVMSNLAGRPGIVQLQHLLAQLAAHGCNLNVDRLFQGRSISGKDFDGLLRQPTGEPDSVTTWLVNGARIKCCGNADNPPREADKPVPPPMALATAGVPPVTESLQMQAPTAEPEVEPHLSGPVPATPGRSQPVATDEKAQIMMCHQRLMQRFLAMQQALMFDYLKRSPQPSAAVDFASGSSLSANQLSAVTDPHPVAAPELANPVKTDASASLLKIVSERTGYPEEVLDLDLDLEADLGIDSIKRIEIVGRLLLSIGPDARHNIEDKTEELTKLRTLRSIITWLEAYAGRDELAIGKGDEASQDAGVSEAQGTASLDSALVQRYVLEVEPLSVIGFSDVFTPAGVIVITDDENGLASCLSKKMQAAGCEVALAHMGAHTTLIDRNHYQAAFASYTGAGELLDLVRRQQGSIGGLIHLMPLKAWLAFEDLTLAQWKDRLQQEVQSLFYLLQNLLKESSTAPKSGLFVVGATGMGGSFASVGTDRRHASRCGNAAIAGLLKTAAVEWPAVKMRVVDLNPEEDSETLCKHLIAEIGAPDDVVEVGYNGNGRVRLKPILAPLEGEAPKAVQIDSASVLLVTGGARGITAQVALELARRYQPTMVLVGRSAAPADVEGLPTAGLTSAQDLKTALIDECKRQGQPIHLQQIEASYKGVLKTREMLANLEAMRAAGAKVTYVQVDVRDEAAFGGLIDDLYTSYGRLDGVIHGAGIIEDKLIKEKTWESFASVFGTKTESAFILSRKLRSATLKFLIFFTSVAGRFGNAGQGDYAAANEVLNKLAVYLDANWSSRVVSINWGPWATTGMVGPELQQQFAARGIEMVPPEIGVQFLNREIARGTKGTVEVIVGHVTGW